LTNEAKKLLINDIPIPTPNSEPYLEVEVGEIRNEFTSPLAEYLSEIKSLPDSHLLWINLQS
jgi:hypothetical protein